MLCDGIVQRSTARARCGVSRLLRAKQGQINVVVATRRSVESSAATARHGVAGPCEVWQRHVSVVPGRETRSKVKAWNGLANLRTS